MSSHAVISRSPVNIDRYMSRELGLDSSLTESERAAFAEFSSLQEHEDYIFLWACAQMTADEMAKQNPELILTQYGISEKAYLEGEVEMTAYEESITKRRVLDTNRTFLNLWKLKVAEMQAQRDRINSLSDETRELLNRNVYAVEAIRRVVNVLIKDGFSPTDPNVVNTPVSVAYSKGVHIHAENDLKEVREVWLFLPGGKTKIHVSTQNPLNCTKAAMDTAVKVAEVLKGIGGASIPISTQLGGAMLDGNKNAPTTNRSEPLTSGIRQQAPFKSEK